MIEVVVMRASLLSDVRDEDWKGKRMERKEDRLVLLYCIYLIWKRAS